MPYDDWKLSAGDDNAGGFDPEYDVCTACHEDSHHGKEDCTHPERCGCWCLVGALEEKE